MNDLRISRYPVAGLTNIFLDPSDRVAGINRPYIQAWARMINIHGLPFDSIEWRTVSELLMIASTTLSEQPSHE